LDGTLVPTDRVAARAERGPHLWYSGKHHPFSGSMQVFADPTGFPLWVSDVRPGSTHDLDPRPGPRPAHALPTRRTRAAGAGRDGLTAGLGVQVLIRHHPDGPLHVDNRRYSQLMTALARWLKITDRKDGLAPTSAGARGGDARDESAELRELRRRNKLLEENEILRRATAYFARDVLPRWPTRWSVKSPSNRSLSRCLPDAGQFLSRPTASGWPIR